jgi:hypothetical protein
MASWWQVATSAVISVVCTVGALSRTAEGFAVNAREPPLSTGAVDIPVRNAGGGCGQSGYNGGLPVYNPVWHSHHLRKPDLNAHRGLWMIITLG